MLDHAEYVEQAYLFDLLRQRAEEQIPTQELLSQLRHELLTTTRLPMAVDYLLTELRHSGLMMPAMAKLSHYFSPFQTYLIGEAESESGRFLMPLALQILHFDACLRRDYVGQLTGQPSGGGVTSVSGKAPLPRMPARPAQPTEEGALQQRLRSGFFFFQFETLCRNRLGYDAGLTAMASDPAFDDDWKRWLLKLRAQVGLVDLADLLFLVSNEYRRQLQAAGEELSGKGPWLFGEREGRIALANRRKDPTYLFGAMQRHLAYPPVPRPVRAKEDHDTIPKLLRRIERLESRIKLMEQEQKQSFDITQFSGPEQTSPLPD
ncbi:MAG: hypothetical protein AAGD07_00115 [Planctomycetota bacterium]